MPSRFCGDLGRCFFARGQPLPRAWCSHTICVCGRANQLGFQGGVAKQPVGLPLTGNTRSKQNLGCFTPRSNLSWFPGGKATCFEPKGFHRQSLAFMNSRWSSKRVTTVGSILVLCCDARGTLDFREMMIWGTTMKLYRHLLSERFSIPIMTSSSSPDCCALRLFIEMFSLSCFV